MPRLFSKIPTLERDSNSDCTKYMRTSIKSPLRYPGGKSRAIPQILTHLPKSFTEFREPFVGGGSVFLTIRQKYPRVNVWINDLNYDLYCFWLMVQKDAELLSDHVLEIRNGKLTGRELFELYRDPNEQLSEFARALRFFVLNRITFSGTVDSGGYSEPAYKSRFTHSAITRLRGMGEVLQGVKITCLDYKAILRAEGENVLIFLDPPYLKATQSRLYGKNGDLHLAFDHQMFADEMRQTRHKWLITYDDSPEIRQNFYFANVHEWELQYGMNNYKQDKASKGKELFIANYVLEPEQIKLF